MASEPPQSPTPTGGSPRSMTDTAADGWEFGSYAGCVRLSHTLAVVRVCAENHAFGKQHVPGFLSNALGTKAQSTRHATLKWYSSLPCFHGKVSEHALCRPMYFPLGAALQLAELSAPSCQQFGSNNRTLHNILHEHPKQRVELETPRSDDTHERPRHNQT